MALSREEIASRYSKALFAYAQDAKKLDEVHEDMNVLLQVAKENPDMLRLLSDPIIRIKKKIFYQVLVASFLLRQRIF